MKKISPFLIVLILIMTGCSDSDKVDLTDETSRIIIPKLNSETDSGEKIYNDTEMPSDRFFTDGDIRYKVLLSKIIDADNDESNEEILIAKNITNPLEKELYIIYSSSLGNSGEEVLAKTDKKQLNLDSIASIRLESGDFSNKGRSEIAIWGFSSNGNQTLDLLRIDPFSGKLHSIAGINEKGSIEIRYNDQYGYKFPSPKIYVHKDKHEPDNSITIIRDVYEWDFFGGEFHLQQTETMAATTIDKENLYKVYYGNVHDFAEYLSGGWIRIKSEENKSVEILFFSPDENLIYYFGDGIIEGYKWGNSRKLMSNRLFINSGNFLIDSQKNTFTVTIHDMETIEMASNSKVIDLVGKYQKVNISLNSILKNDQQGESTTTPLSGLFKNDAQFSILFNLPIVTLYKEGNTYNGIAKTFNFKGKNVIEFDFPGQAGENPIGVTNSFIFETRESKDSNHRIKTLLLYPAKILALKIEKIPADALQIEQIETTTSEGEE